MTEILKFCDNDYLLLGGLPPPESHWAPAASRRALRGVEAAIIDEARTWLGTPFKHQGRIKGVGCDCLGLLIGVAKALDLQGRGGQKLADLDNLSYGHFPNEDALRKGLENALYSAKKLGKGCIVLMQIDGRTQHLGIIGNLESGTENLEEENSRLQIPDSRFQISDPHPRLCPAPQSGGASLE